MDSRDGVGIKNQSPLHPRPQTKSDVFITEGILFWIALYQSQVDELKGSRHGMAKTGFPTITERAVALMRHVLRRQNFESPVLKSPVWKPQAYANYRQAFYDFKVLHEW